MSLICVSEGPVKMSTTTATIRPSRDRHGRDESPQGEALRIAILGPTWFPVPPDRYGGIEAVVSLLADGLVANGHDVTLFASGDSVTQARLVAVHEVAPSAQIGQTEPELLHALACIRDAGSFDVISDHSGPLGVALSGLHATPTVHTVHGPLSQPVRRVYDAALAVAPSAQLVSLTDAQRTPRPNYPWLATIHNAVDLAGNACRPSPGGGYLLWLGRMCHEKGPDRAIEVARAAGMPLLLAGKNRERAEREYFERFVAPQLDEQIRYVGEVTASERVELLHGAVALINPIAWSEPFGLVMIEALACGVPVIATRRGSVPELIEDGVTGVIVNDYREMPDAIDRVRTIKPSVCRAVAEQRYSAARLADDYARALRSLVMTPRSIRSL
jgi:glycosyltransferase involved in cell wall biosynthesis